MRWTDAQGQQRRAAKSGPDKLDLYASGQIASRLPLDAETHKALAAYAPSAWAVTLSARWESLRDKLQSYEARGRASKLRSHPGLGDRKRR